MKRITLLLLAVLSMCLTVSAQQKVHQNFKVSDGNFNVNNFGSNNSANAVANSFTLGDSFASVAWNLGGVDLSGYDKLYIKIDSCVGNNVQFRIFDTSGGEYEYPDNIVMKDNDASDEDAVQEIEIDFTDPDALERVDGSGMLDLTSVNQFVFWNYWDTGKDKTDPTNEHYDPDYVDLHPGGDATVYISEFYLERTLKNGEKDYVDLLKTYPFSFTDADFESEDGSYVKSYMDSLGVLHMQENAEAGFFFDEEPQDWSAYKYLVVVPQKPFSTGDPTVRYVLTDAEDNAFDGGTLRWGWYNRGRAAVQDLTNITNEKMDDDVQLESFDPSKIASLKWALWGGVQSWEYGIAGVWLSNTAPTYSTAFTDGTDGTGDYVIENSAENSVGTICLPFASALCGAQVYTLAGVDDPSNPSEIYAAPYYGILEAGKPYIYRTNSARNITAFQAGANEVAAPVANGALTADAFATYYVTAGENYLVLNENGDGFAAVTDDDGDVRVNSNTAYVDINKLPQATEQENGLVFSVTGAKAYTPVTAIKGIANDNVKKSNDGFIYDLLGRRVSKPAKGVYIQNGKKFVVK